MELISGRSLYLGGAYIRVKLIWVELISGQSLYLGGAYIREELISGWSLYMGGAYIREELISGQSLYQGGAYIWAELISGWSLYQGGTYKINRWRTYYLGQGEGRPDGRNLQNQYLSASNNYLVQIYRLCVTSNIMLIKGVIKDNNHHNNILPIHSLSLLSSLMHAVIC